MKYKWLVMLIPAVFILVFQTVHAHGVKGEVREGGLAVSARYDTGEAMSYAKVKVLSPGAKLTFQSGRTDKNGRFCFLPDTPGEWKVVVDDEMGHLLELLVQVDERFGLKAGPHKTGEAGGGLNRYEKALMGISIIFGVTGILFWWMGRKSLKNTPSTGP